MSGELSRRELLRYAALGAGGVGVSALLAACGSGGGTSAPPSSSPSPSAPAANSIAALRQGTTEFTLATTQSPVNPGRSYFNFALIALTGSIVTGGTADVYLAAGENSPTLGPFTAPWYEFTGYAKTHDHSPKTPLPGAFATYVDAPGPGNWIVFATAGSGSKKVAAASSLEVTSGRVAGALGSKATPVDTPVATTENGLRAICTRKPPCHMHYVSLAEAISNGKPTVAVFSTPLLCESRLCGPVTDEVILLYQRLGPHRANFVHVEEFLPGPKHHPPAPTAANQSPAFKAWGFSTEPWTILIDKAGIVRGRFLGLVTAPQIDTALRPLL